MLVFRRPYAFDWHEVSDFAYTIIAEKARQEDIGFGQVELLALHCSHVGGTDAKKATFSRIKDGPKHTRRIETRQTTPVEGAILSH
jgi:hypothetical protein